jgi:hypothetical protein
MLKHIGSNTIICSGVSVGSIDTVLPYLDQVKSLIEGKTIVPYITTNHFPTCERNGVDQGLHNVLVYTKQIQNLQIWSQANSPVLNLQAKVARVEGMKVSNMKGAVVAVVHQYDRYPDLQRLLFKEVSHLTDKPHSNCHSMWIGSIPRIRWSSGHKLRNVKLSAMLSIAISSKVSEPAALVDILFDFT